MIVDASLLLSALFPDEVQPQAQAVLRFHVSGQERLCAPTLLVYEISHALWQAEGRGRISSEQVDRILEVVKNLEMDLFSLDWSEILPLARQTGCSAYDAAYLALAQRRGEPLVTADRRLYNAVHEKFSWVRWLGDEQP